MRKFYRSRRNRVVDVLNRCPLADRLTIHEEDAGLHFLLKVDTDMEDWELTSWCESHGIRVRTLGSYYHKAVPEDNLHCLVVNYAGLREDDLEQILNKLQ